MLLAESDHMITDFGVTERKEHRLWDHIKVGVNLYSATSWLTLSKLINSQIFRDDNSYFTWILWKLEKICEMNLVSWLAYDNV